MPKTTDSDNVLDLLPPADEDDYKDTPPVPPPVRVTRRPRTKPGVNLQGVDPSLVEFATGRDFTITSGRDSAGVHVRNSRHGRGEAIDLRVRDKSPDEVNKAISEANASGFHAAYEHKGQGNATGDHIHLSRGRVAPNRTPPAPKPPDSENVLDMLPPAADNVLDMLPVDDAPDVPRETPQVKSEVPLDHEAGHEAGHEGATPILPPSTTSRKGQIEAGNIDLQHRPIVHNVDGSISTVYSTVRGFDEDGREKQIVIPRVSDDGRILSENEAAQEYLRTHKHLGKFDNAEDASAFAEALHQQQAQRYGSQVPPPAAPSKAAIPPPASASTTPQPAGVNVRAKQAGAPTDAPATIPVKQTTVLPATTPQLHAEPQATGGVALDIDVGTAIGSAASGSVAEKVVRHALTQAGYGDVADSYLASLRAANVPLMQRSQTGEPITDEDVLAYAQQKGGKFRYNLIPATVEQLQSLREQKRLSDLAPSSPLDPLLNPDKATRDGAGMRAQLGAMNEHAVQDATTNWQMLAQFGTPQEKETARAHIAQAPSQQSGPTDTTIGANLDTLNTVERGAMQGTYGFVADLAHQAANLLDTASGPLWKKGAQYGIEDSPVFGTQLYTTKTEGPNLVGIGAPETLPMYRSVTDFLRNLSGGAQKVSAYESPNDPRNSVLNLLGHTLPKAGVEMGGQVVELGTIQRLTGAPFSVVMGAQAAVSNLDNPKALIPAVGKGILLGKYFDAMGGLKYSRPANIAINSTIGFTLANLEGKNLKESIAETILFGGLGVLHGGDRSPARDIAEGRLPVPESLRARVAAKMGYEPTTVMSEDGRYAAVDFNPETKDVIARPITAEQAAERLPNDVEGGESLYGAPGASGRVRARPPFMRVPDDVFDGMLPQTSAERGARAAEAREKEGEEFDAKRRVATGRLITDEAGQKSAVSSDPAADELQQMRAQYAAAATDALTKFRELSEQHSQAEDPDEAERIYAQIGEVEEELHHYVGLVRDIDAHTEHVRQIESEVSAQESEEQPVVKAKATTATATPKTEGQIITRGGYQGAERRERERDEETDLQYFRTALSDHNITLSAAHEDGKYEFHMPDGQTVRVSSHDEMTRKARELLIQQQTIDQTSGVRATEEQEDTAPAATEGAWQPFPTESGTLGVPRAQMPQIKSEHRGALVQYLKARGVEHEQMLVRPSSLKPTQAEYSPAKVEKAREWSAEGPNRSILVSGDGYVLDGHHQWQQALEDAPDEAYPVIKFDADARELLPLIHDFPSSTVNRESEGGAKAEPTTAESFADEIGEAGSEAEETGSVSPLEKFAAHAGKVREAQRAFLADRGYDYDAPETIPVRKRKGLQQEWSDVKDEYISRQNNVTSPSSQLPANTTQGSAVGRTFTLPSGKTATVRREYTAPQSGTPMYEVEVGGKALDVPRARVQFGDEYPTARVDVINSPEHPANIRRESERGTTGEEERPPAEEKQQESESDFRRRVREAKERQRKKTFHTFGPDDFGDWSLIVAGEIADGARSLKDLMRKLREDWPEHWGEIKQHAERLWESARLSLDLEGEHTDDLAEFFAPDFDEVIKGIERHAEHADDFTDRAGSGAGEVRDAVRGTKGREEVSPGEGQEVAEEKEYVHPDPLEPRADDPPRVALGRRLARSFINGRTFSSITEARKHAGQLLGHKVESGTQDAKDTDEAIEIGVGIAAREIVAGHRASGKSDAVIYQRLVNLYTQQQPNLSVRTSTSAIEQAYSTPAPLAFVASRLAGINRRTTVLENSAGNGMLLIEASPETVVANEKNATRFASLEALFPLADVRQGDALTLDTGRQVDRYIANPPFGTVKEKTIGGGETNVTKEFEPMPGWKTSQIDHAIAFAGLGQMAENGRAVLIVGSVRNEVDPAKRADQYDNKNKRLFYYHLYRNYNVVDHFTVSGDLYERQGAGWPVDVIVIGGRGKSERKLPTVDVPRVYKTWADLAEVLDGAHREAEIGGVDAGDRPQESGGSTRRGGADTGGAGAAGREDVPRVFSGQGTEDDRGGGADADAGARGADTSTGLGGVDGPLAGQSEGGGSRADNGESDASDEARGDRSAGPTAEEDIRREPGSAEARGRDESGDVDGIRAEPAERAKIDIAKTQVPYAPASTARGMGTLIPVNMATAAQDALDALIKRLGGVRGDDTLDRFVADRLGYEDVADVEKRFGAEQVDAIALAIDNIERAAGMILGDQTGIGKGRPVAAVLEYARILNRVPIFVTEKPTLYKDIVRDLVDIGAGTLEELRDRILMTNANQVVPLNDDPENKIELKTPDAKTHNAALTALYENDIPGANGYRLPAGKQYLFTTYSQMQKIGGITARQSFLDAISRGAIIVFDESHNAGGTENAGWGKKDKDTGAAQHDPLSRAGFARGMIENAHGVFYSSATFAKRASVMDLYSKTDMRLSVSNVPLAEMIAKGGVPLQQIVSSMLVESGQMLRRERSFDGIEYATAVAPVHQESAETVSAVMRAVFDFDKVKKEAFAGIRTVIRENAETIGVDPATGAASASSTTFSSLIHNLVDQMLLSLKMEPAIEHALDTLRRNEKPVITVSMTMGSFLKNYALDFSLQPGEAVALNFGDMLKRYLDRTRDVTYKRPDNSTYRVRLTDEQLGPHGVALYNAAVRMIQEADWSKMPVSPIDYIKYRIESEVDPKTGRNYKVGEITGRTEALDYSEHFRTNGEAPPTFRRRSQKDKSIKGRIGQIVGFNEGSIDVMVLNQAGSTGLSLHASERVSDQRKRHMIIAQPERNIDTHMQLLGRVHRTGQVVLPRYTQLVADIPSEKRPAAVLAKKMASLNANTTAARGSKFKADSVVDFMNQYGDDVALQLMQNNPDLHDRLGEPLLGSEGEMDSDDAARRVTGRLPILQLAEQNEIYDELEQEYTDLIDRLNAMGENALEAQTLALDAKTIGEKEIFKGTGERPFERGAVAEDVDVKRLRKPYSSAQVLDLTRKSLAKRFGELKAAEPVTDEDDLGELARAGEHLQGYQRAAMQGEFDKFLAGELERILATPHKDESQEEADSRAEQRRRVTEARHKEVLRRWQTTHKRFHVGQTVQVVSTLGQLYGVVTDIHRSGRTANPAALGAWKIQVALADAARSVPVPFSKVIPEGGYSAGASIDDFAGEHYAIAEADEAEVFDFSAMKRVTLPVLEAFERGQSVSRERRIIITGNLLAGFGRFEKARGQIINFTDSEGNLRQGILMPKEFDIEKALDDEPIKFQTAEHILSFLDSTPGMVTTTDGQFKIVKQGRDYKFSAPRARVAQKYWGNEAVRDAAGQDFVTKGDSMVVTVPQKRASAVIEAALAEGWTFHTTTHKERAREVAGQSQKGGAEVVGANPPYSERFAGGVGAQGGAPTTWRDLASGVADKLRALVGRQPAAAEWNYSGMGGVKTRLVRNLSQLEKAAPASHAAAVRAAGMRSLSRVLIRRAAYRIQETMRTQGGWDAFRATLVESRLVGIRNRWLDLSDIASTTTDDEEFKEFYAGGQDGPSVRDLVLRFEHSEPGQEFRRDWNEGGRTSMATIVDGMVAAGDFDSARSLLGEMFGLAAENVANVAPRTAFNAMIGSDQFTKALDVYKELLEKPMAESHALNEGVFSDALGPLDTYYPLIPLDESGERIKGPSSSSHDPYRMRGNIHNRFASGLSPQYDLTVEGLEGSLSHSLRANAIDRMLRQLEEDGLARPLKKNDPDEHVVTFEGVDYAAKTVRVGKDRTILREGKSINIPARRWAVAGFVEKELRPILESEDYSHSKIAALMNKINLIGMSGPIDAAAHTANMVGAVIAGTPYVGTDILSKTIGNTPATKVFASVINLLRTDVWDDEAVKDIEEMTALGVIPTRYASVASGLTKRGRDFAAKTGIEKKYVSLAPLIYGPAGFDIRARLLFYRVSKEMDRATGKTMTPRERTRFITQLGNYTYELQGDVERWLKKYGLAPFYTAGSTMWRNGINIWLGRTPLPKSYDFNDRAKYRAATMLSGAAVGLVVLWALASLLYRGKWPWDDKKSRLISIPLNDADRNSWLAKKVCGDNAKDCYIGLGFFSPLVERGAHAVGAAGAYDAWMAGGTGGQIGEGAEKDIINSVIHPFFSGPALKAAFVAVTTKEPYVQSLRDSITGERSIDLRDATKKAPAGTATTKARIVEGAAALNSFYGDIAHHLGFVQDAFDLDDPERNVPEDARPSRWLRSILDLVAPRLAKGTYDVDTARRRLEREDKAARAVRPAPAKMPAERRTKVERALSEAGVTLRAVQHTLPYPAGSPNADAGKKKELTQEEVVKYQQDFADLFYKSAEAYVDSPAYAREDAEHHRDVLEEKRRDAHKQATENAASRWDAARRTVKPDIKLPPPK